MERDYTTWLEQGGLSRMVSLEGRDLTDPAVFAEVISELALEPHRAEYAGSLAGHSLMSDASARWASLVGTFINAVHSDTLDALRAETSVMAASLDGGHAGGCG
ncbi:hypothetical protein AB0B12_12990 [Streptomyces sp. NPDC044780]|uniref:Uncharacterized protein n=1 Tax=Streptomyces luomodiensis TaxID=3026192 RepID=A0ABY9UXZ4_9ACTN|nr:MULTISPECIES: hypothetical protein [unclassified Streptomyces]WAP56732.1 hypothetical protein N6H00_18175 [Streptomyces sp. S465]WNE97291.1 hypothetical protein PS467_19115 [Streptomyces sp. SCA4-21]